MEETSNIQDSVAANVIPSKFTVNVSTGKKYLTQRDNKIRPYGTCNSTSMIMMLSYSGINLPSKKNEDQYEDVLTNFLLTDPGVLSFYSHMDPEGFKAWKANPESKSVYPPNEVHSVLSFGTNLWLRAPNTVAFTTLRPLSKILFDLLKGKATVVSGVWSGLHHIVCVVGFETTQDPSSITKPSDLDVDKVLNVIVDDPYGDYKTKYVSTQGNDIYVPLEDYNKMTKSQGDISNKWAHFIVGSA